MRPCLHYAITDASSAACVCTRDKLATLERIVDKITPHAEGYCGCAYTDDCRDKVRALIKRAEPYLPAGEAPP